MMLLECQDPTNLHLHTPDKAEIDLVVETFYWNAKAELAGMDLAEVPVQDLPPCMCRMYANIDAIFSDWEKQKHNLIDDHNKLKRKLQKKDRKNKGSQKKRVGRF
jgi:hypothetical protein